MRVTHSKFSVYFVAYVVFLALYAKIRHSIPCIERRETYKILLSSLEVLPLFLSKWEWKRIPFTFGKDNENSLFPKVLVSIWLSSFSYTFAVGLYYFSNQKNLKYCRCVFLFFYSQYVMNTGEWRTIIQLVTTIDW